MPSGVYTRNIPKYIIEAFRTYEGKFYWRLKGKNKKILCHSETYTSKDMCMKTAKLISNDLQCKLEYLDVSKDYEL